MIETGIVRGGIETGFGIHGNCNCTVPLKVAARFRVRACPSNHSHNSFHIRSHAKKKPSLAPTSSLRLMPYKVDLATGNHHKTIEELGIGWAMRVCVFFFISVPTRHGKKNTAKRERGLNQWTRKRTHFPDCQCSIREFTLRS